MEANDSETTQGAKHELLPSDGVDGLVTDSNQQSVRDVIQYLVGKELATFDSQIVEIFEQLRVLRFKAQQTDLQMKKNELVATAATKSQCNETLQKAEEKLAEGLLATLEQSKQLDQKLSAGMMMQQEAILKADRQVAELHVKLEKLDELTQLKLQRGSILHAVREDILQHVNRELVTKFNEQIEKEQTTHSQTKSKLDDTFLGLQSVKLQVWQLSESVKSQFSGCVSTEDFEEGLGKYTKLKDFQELDVKTKLFVKKDFVTENFNKVGNEIANLKRHTAEKFAQKNELAKQEMTIRKWATQTFAHEEDTNQKQKSDEARINNLESKSRELATLANEQLKMYQDIKELLGTKADHSEVTQLRTKLHRLATIDDYKALYDKVVPPVALVQTQMTDYSRDQVQFQEIIRRFDDNCRLFAMKHEILEYSIELRSCCKDKVFQEFKARTQATIEEHNTNLASVQVQIQQVKAIIAGEIRNGIQQAMMVFKQRQLMASSKSSEPGSTIQGDFKQDMALLIQNKAEVQDLHKLRDEKANKIDLQAQLQCMQVIHRMLANMAVILIETVKSGIRTNQSGVEHQKTQVFLLKQTQHVAQWIQNFNPLLVSVDSKIPLDIRPLDGAVNQFIETLPVYLDNEPICTHIASQRIKKKMEPRPSWQSSAIQDLSSSRIQMVLSPTRQARNSKIAENVAKSTALARPGEMKDLLKPQTKMMSTTESNNFDVTSQLPGIIKSSRDSFGDVLINELPHSAYLSSGSARTRNDEIKVQLSARSCKQQKD